jgi:fibrillarin-like rRNA methylase
MHDGTVAAGDTWISRWLPQIVAGPDYQSGDLVIFLAWDEGSGSGTTVSHVADIVVSPFTTPGTTSATPFDHNSLLRTTEEIAGLPGLGDAVTANSMRSDFGL